jgi:ElaB/YqjD/DUF883 family membrane-anchored ribosome-binding protein
MAGSGTNGGQRGDGGADAPLEAEEQQRMQVEHYVESARAELDRYVEQAATFIRERPVAAVAGALALGYALGRLASRR